MPSQSLMSLRILLPFCIFATESAVSRIVADTGTGSLGILPHRMDCVTALTPGILVYETGDGGEAYIAVAEGILIKTGLDVLVSVHNAIRGSDLLRLHETVEREFMIFNEREQHVRSVVTRMESAFVQRIGAFHHG